MEDLSLGLVDCVLFSGASLRVACLQTSNDMRLLACLAFYDKQRSNIHCGERSYRTQL